MAQVKTICTTTGLPLTSSPDWRIVSHDGLYKAQLSILGTNIIHTEISGYTTIDISLRFLDLIDHLHSTEIGIDNKFILIENYSNHTGTSREARNYYVSRQRKNPKLLAVIFYNVSPFFSMMIRFGRLFVGLPFPIEIASNYTTSINLAKSLVSKPISPSKSNDDQVKQLINFIGLINWKEAGLPPEVNSTVTDQFRPLYDALNILKNDYDEIMKQKMAASTKQIEMQEQLHHAERMQTIGTLTGGVAHDFNNMMSAITGFAALMKKRFGQLDPGIDRYSTLIMETGNRATTLIQKLLNFARKGREEKQSILLSDVFEDLSPLIHHVVNKEISIVYSLLAPATKLLGDKAQIQNALMNLAMNSSDSMVSGGTITISSVISQISEDDLISLILPLAPGSYLEISVTDTGTGISSEIFGSIFSTFFTTKATGKGTGLGLSNVLSMAKSHKGSVKFSSTLGKGSTFTLYFPFLS